MAAKGLITDIKRYAIHDGPGIRTTVFFKGCPLSCPWCHNPECISSEKDLMYFEYKCISCGICIKECPEDALEKEGPGVKINYSLCTSCERCAEVCPTGALEIKGQWYSVGEVMKELEKDLLFYDSSEGGVTFSGGEPLYQPDFLLALLKECRRGRIHTVLDTSGCADREIMEQVMDYVDLFYYDLKLTDRSEQKKFLGSEIENSFRNLELLNRAGRGSDTVIRIAVIPGISDTGQNLEGLMEVLSSLQGLKEIHLLPYHDVREKFRRLGRKFSLNGLSSPEKKELEFLQEKIAAGGFRVKI